METKCKESERAIHSVQALPSAAHTPVLLNEVIRLFEPVFNAAGRTAEQAHGAGEHASVRDGAECKQASKATEPKILVDCTLGLGGHSEALLERFESVKIVGIDRDADALSIAKRRLSRFGNRVSFYHDTFDELDTALGNAGFEKADGILMDLGLSSMQIDETHRGFSYIKDAELDMRMDQKQDLDAKTVVNTYSSKELAHILRLFGEEKFASRIAETICRARAKKGITTTGELALVVRDALPYALKYNDLPTLKRVFQAIRVEVNGELELLKQAIPKGIDLLKVGGRFVVESYQSLEDRIVKQTFRSATEGKTPQNLPFELDEHSPIARKIRTAKRADANEVSKNSRSASAIIRAIEKER